MCRGDEPLWGAALSLIDYPIRFLHMPYLHGSHQVCMRVCMCVLLYVCCMDMEVCAFACVSVRVCLCGICVLVFGVGCMCDSMCHVDCVCVNH